MKFIKYEKKDFPLLCKIVKKTPGTVIDPVWEDSISYKTFRELKKLTGCKSYKKLLYYYEGYTIEEMLDSLNTEKTIWN